MLSDHEIEFHPSPSFHNSAVAFSTQDVESDYGDFGEDAEELEIVDRLLREATEPPENLPLAVTDIEDYEPPRGVRLPKILGFEQTHTWQASQQFQIAYDGETTSANAQLEKRKEASQEPYSRPEPQTDSQVEQIPDTRSPLERFRRPPKKALSVTDLVSPSWCELQYFYTLSKHGRKRRTPAMKQGTKVHQALEDEVHTTVPIEVTKIEDSWGLRIWNIIQGLRTLRETGRTRELEIWGTVGGEIVNGVIDEISYGCPDPKLEENVNALEGKQEIPVLPEYQTTITEFFLSGAQKEEGQSISTALNGESKTKSRQKRGEKQIYITDIKTRGSSSLPTGSSIRPTILQLHLYHHMLENLAQGNFIVSQLADRYNLDVNEPFSDGFIAQIGNLNQDIYDEISLIEPQSPLAVSSQDSIDLLLSHNTLSSLWEFMLSQFRQTFILPSQANPENQTNTTTTNSIPISSQQSIISLSNPPTAPPPTRLSPIITAEYISQSYIHQPNTTRQSLGKKSFIFNAEYLRSYLQDNLAWWKGERDARGVDLSDAWKCRSCDFRDDCEWIHMRDKEALEKVLERKKIREVVMKEDEKKEGWGKSRV